MFRRRITLRTFAPFRLSVRLATALAVIGIGLSTRSSSAADFIYVSLQNNTIVRYDISLATSALVQASGSVFVPTGQGLNNPRGLAFDTAGNLYAANNGNTITRYDSSGTYIGGTPFVGSFGQGLNAPLGLAFDSAGNLYAANLSNRTITRYDSSGTYIEGRPFVSGSGVNLPVGLAFDTAGNLYVGNSNSITRYDSSGTYIGGQPFVGNFGQGLNSPGGLAFDTAGNLYVANQWGNTITRYDSSGTYIGGTPFVDVDQGLDYPNDLAFDTAGNLYVTNAGTQLNPGSTISKFDSAGVLQFSWSTPARPLYLAFPTVVPEPSTYVLGAIATGLMAVIARRRKAAAKG